MKKLLFILLISTSLMAQFKSYDVPKLVTLEDLTTSQLELAIDKFAEGWSVTKIVTTYYVDRKLVQSVFNGIKKVESYAYNCMQDSVVNVSADLLVYVNAKFPKYINVNEYLLTKMVLYSKKDGSGNWEFYLSQFTED